MKKVHVREEVNLKLTHKRLLPFSQLRHTLLPSIPAALTNSQLRHTLCQVSPHGHAHKWLHGCLTQLILRETMTLSPKIVSQSDENKFRGWNVTVDVFPKIVTALADLKKLKHHVFQRYRRRLRIFYLEFSIKSFVKSRKTLSRRRKSPENVPFQVLRRETWQLLQNTFTAKVSAYKFIFIASALCESMFGLKMIVSRDVGRLRKVRSKMTTLLKLSKNDLWSLSSHLNPLNVS